MRRRRRAFTLIELVASAVLAAMMMIALVNVIWSAARDTRQLRDEQLTRASVTLLIDRLRADLHNARGISFDAGGITLHGFIGEDPTTLGSTLLLATVRYESVRIGEHQALLRRHSEGGRSTREPIWIGCRGLKIEPLAEMDPEDADLPDPAAGDLPPIPSSFRVTLLGHKGHILWREVVHHHAI